MVRRTKSEMVQLKLRFNEDLRRRLELAARGSNQSMNAEIIARLESSLARDDPAAWSISELRDEILSLQVALTTRIDRDRKEIASAEALLEVGKSAVAKAMKEGVTLYSDRNERKSPKREEG